MRHFTDSTRNNRDRFVFISLALLFLLSGSSLFSGKYPVSLQGLLSGEEMQQKIFVTLRLARTLTAVFGGFVLGTAGFVYQTVFRNPLASPDIIGVSSGASAGAAAGILLAGSTLSVTLCSFGGALLSVAAALLLSTVDRSGRKSTIVLAGIAVHAVAQAVLMCLKLSADPEKELSAIEFWIMGSLSSVRITDLPVQAGVCTGCLVFVFLLHRQALILSSREDEAKMLGTPVVKIRSLVLLFATLMVSAVVSLTGIISFIGLLAPHSARLLTRRNDQKTLLLSGLLGSCFLLAADILARNAARTELPVSIFTSLIGAPFLLFLCIKGGKEDE